MPQSTNRSLLVVVLVFIALAAPMHSAVAGDKDRGSSTKVSPPPDGGFWYKIIVHNCLPKTAVTMRYVIDRAGGTPFKNEREKFEDKGNSYQSQWIPMEEGKFSIERIEFLDVDGKVVLAIPYTGKDITLPFRFELTRAVPASAVALPAQKEYGQCKIIR